MADHDALCPVDPPRTVGDGYCLWCEVIAEVRADQDDRECDHCTDLARLKITDLRAKVEALPARGVVYPYDLDSLVPETLLYRADVLALIDGRSDGLG